MMQSSAVLFLLLVTAVDSFVVNLQSPSCRITTTELDAISRRNLVLSSSSIIVPAAAAALLPQVANAGIDPSMLKALPVEGDSSGAAMRLNQLKGDVEGGSREEDLLDVPYTELENGVSYREYREGKGDAVIQDGSKVAVEMTIRCQSFRTAKEPGGVKYFSTKDDTEFNELAWTVGAGALPKELEESMKGMHKNGVRRIVLPSTAVFAARNKNQLPEPTTKEGKRRYENLFKTDAALLFEVLVTRIK